MFSFASRIRVVISLGILTVAMAITAPLSALAGGQDGGGSCLVKDGQGRSTLKDFLVFRSGYADDGRQGEIISALDDPALKLLHFTVLDGRYSSYDVKKSAAFNNALRIVGSWSLYYPSVCELILSALRSMKVYATDFYIHTSALGCAAAGEKPLFVYQSELKGPVLSIPRWNSLSTAAQTGALIKEAFRLIETDTSNNIVGSLVKDKSSQSFGLEVEKGLSRWVGSLVLTNPKNSAAVDALVELGSGYAFEQYKVYRFILEHHLYDRTLEVIADFKNRFPMIHSDLAQGYLDEGDLSGLLTFLEKLRQALLGVPADQLESLSLKEQKRYSQLLHEIALKTLDLERLLFEKFTDSPRTVVLQDGLKNAVELLKQTKKVGDDEYASPVLFDDVRSYLNDKNYSLKRGNIKALTQAVSEYSQRIQEGLKSGLLSKEDLGP